jgi:catalase (peroxidase I)
MRFDPEASWGANAGLDIPRKALEVVKVRPYIVACFAMSFITACQRMIFPTSSHLFQFFSQAKFPEISYADLYTLAGVTAVEQAG